MNLNYLRQLLMRRPETADLIAGGVLTAFIIGMIMFLLFSLSSCSSTPMSHFPATPSYHYQQNGYSN